MCFLNQPDLAHRCVAEVASTIGGRGRFSPVEESHSHPMFINALVCRCIAMEM